MEHTEYFRLAWGRLLERIEEKTSWGKNELKQLMLEVLIDISPIADRVQKDKLRSSGEQ